jgi:hypothetical protein
MEPVEKWHSNRRYGYVVVALDKYYGNVVRAAYGAFGNHDRYLIGQWYKSADKPVGKASLDYKPCFHVFFTKADAYEYREECNHLEFPRVAKVEVSQICYRGKLYIFRFSTKLDCFGCHQRKILEVYNG